MSGQSTKLASVLGSLISFYLSTVAEAETTKAPGPKQVSTTQQGAPPEEKVGEIAQYGPRSEEAPAEPRDAAVARTCDLDQQTHHLGKDLETQQEAREPLMPDSRSGSGQRISGRTLPASRSC